MAELTRENFTWHGYSRKGKILVPPWRGFQSRRGPYRAKDSDVRSDGTVDVVFGPEGRDESPLRDSEIELMRWALQNALEMQTSTPTIAPRVSMAASSS